MWKETLHYSGGVGYYIVRILKIHCLAKRIFIIPIGVESVLSIPYNQHTCRILIKIVTEV